MVKEGRVGKQAGDGDIDGLQAVKAVRGAGGAVGRTAK